MVCFQTPHRPVYGIISDVPDRTEIPSGGSLKQSLIALGANTFANLLEKADIKDGLISRGTFTIFAPTEAAFGKLVNIFDKLGINPIKSIYNTVKLLKK